MTVHPLKLPFKGQRWYLRGADVYRQTIPLLSSVHPESPATRIVMKFTKFVTKTCELHIADGDDKPPAGTAATITVNFADRKPVKGWLVETEKPVEFKMASAEMDTFEPSAMRGETMFVNTDNVAIECLIAYTKTLHENLLGKDKGAWMFVGLDISEPLKIEHLRDFKITLLFERNGFTESQIDSGETTLGKILFIRYAAKE